MLLLSGNMLYVSGQKQFYTCHEITIDEFDAWYDAFIPIIVLDIRTKADYEAGHIPGAIWVFGDSAMISISDTLDADQKIIIYDTSGNESIDACLLLASKGKKSVYEVKGGFETWQKFGHLVEKSGS